MFRGYLAGGFWGLVVSALGLGTASLVAEQPAGNDPPEQPSVVSPDAGIAGDTTSVDGVVPDGEIDAGGAPQPSVTPEVDGPDVAVADVDAETAPLDQPDGGEITAGLAAPETPETPTVSLGVEEPVLPNPQGLVPDVPEGEADIVLETTTPDAPVAEEEVVVVEETTEGDVTVPDETETVVVEADDVVPEDEAAALDAEAVADAVTESVSDLPEGDGGAETETVVVTEPEVEEVPTEDDGPAEDVVASAEGVSEGPTAPVLVTPEVDSTLPITPSTDDDDDTPLISLQGDNGGGLPGQGASSFISDDDETPTEEDVAVVEEPVAEVIEGSALTQFAAPFEVSADMPLMSVILVDDGSLIGGEAAISEIPFPVTIALDPTIADAGEKMAAYREAGFEVMAMVEVPDGALATDAEVALQAGFSTLPEVIGLLDLGQAGLQGSSSLAEQAMARLSDAGMGYVAQSQGLNGGLRAADAVDVPARTIYRDLDSEDQDAVVIRRFLDQAAFRARQQGSVILVGRVRPDTISALILWTTAGGTAEVQMAPVSAALTTE